MQADDPITADWSYQPRDILADIEAATRLAYGHTPLHKENKMTSPSPQHSLTQAALIQRLEEVRHGMNQYQELALRTESPITPGLVARFYEFLPTFHDLVFRSTWPEGDWLDKVKRYVYYGDEASKPDPEQYVNRDVWITSIDAKFLVTVLPLPILDPSIAEIILYFDNCTNTSEQAWWLVRYCHGLIGVATELQELSEYFNSDHKNELTFTGTVFEECGDLLWYLGLIASSHTRNLGDIASANIRKMTKRYGEKFDDAVFNAESAIGRDYDAEAQAAEGPETKPSDSIMNRQRIEESEQWQNKEAPIMDFLATEMDRQDHLPGEDPHLSEPFDSPEPEGQTPSVPSFKVGDKVQLKGGTGPQMVVTVLPTPVRGVQWRQATCRWWNSVTGKFELEVFPWEALQHYPSPVASRSLGTAEINEAAFLRPEKGVVCESREGRKV